MTRPVDEALQGVLDEVTRRRLHRELARLLRIEQTMKWISEQRWAEDADLDEICNRADDALNWSGTDAG